MIVNPKSHQTSGVDRHVLRDALSTYIKAESKKLKAMKGRSNAWRNTEKIESKESDIACAESLLIKFEG